MRAARAGCHQIIPVLIGGGVEVDKPVTRKGFEGTTSLYFAAETGRTTALLSVGADVNRARDTDGGSPLFKSAEKGHFDTVKLLEAGADVNQAQEAGATPLFVSAQKGHSNTVKLLLGQSSSQ
jgi:ankyrin repeat protein